MSGQLHLPEVGGQATACGRQLNNHRAQRTQDAVGAAIASTAGEYNKALQQQKACKHCARAVGLLPRLSRPVRQDEEDDGDSDE